MKQRIKDIAVALPLLLLVFPLVCAYLLAAMTAVFVGKTLLSGTDIKRNDKNQRGFAHVGLKQEQA